MYLMRYLCSSHVSSRIMHAHAHVHAYFGGLEWVIVCIVYIWMFLMLILLSILCKHMYHDHSSNHKYVCLYSPFNVHTDAEALWWWCVVCIIIIIIAHIRHDMHLPFGADYKIVWKSLYNCTTLGCGNAGQ